MITVQALLDAETLGLQCLAGQAGAHRLITWAHTVDLPDPWRWVSAGNLVMTTGHGLPRAASDQAIWLERLAQTNASALVFAPQAGAPKLSRTLLNAADRLMFPVLAASFDLEFVKLSQSVIGSVLQAQRESFEASERLFQTYAEAMRSEATLAGRLAVLADSLALTIRIEDAASGIAIVQADSDAAPKSPPKPRLQTERIPIPGRARAELVIERTRKSARGDPLLIRSLVGLLSVELERLMIHRDGQRDEGAALFRSLLARETEFALARPILERRGLAGTLVCLCIDAGTAGAWAPSDIHHAPAPRHAQPLLLDDGALLVLAPDDAAIIDAFAANLGAGTAIGVSGPIAIATGVPESMRQARLALAQAIETQAGVLRYGDAETGLIMAPRSLEQARAVVGRYLGPVIEYDRLHNSALLATLAAFLDRDGNWKATAIDLGIHRQTLVYRLRLVEQLTALKPTTTNGIARFWIAVQAGRHAGLIGA